ncbi:MAG: hypothetical protein GC137_03010 [Alphaproteobacteria bacterium]|nr:hypothetical protein [Alphaproteobacteria bacterium]
MKSLTESMDKAQKRDLRLSILLDKMRAGQYGAALRDLATLAIHFRDDEIVNQPFLKALDAIEPHVSRTGVIDVLKVALRYRTQPGTFRDTVKARWQETYDELAEENLEEAIVAAIEAFQCDECADLKSGALFEKVLGHVGEYAETNPSRAAGSAMTLMLNGIEGAEQKWREIVQKQTRENPQLALQIILGASERAYNYRDRVLHARILAMSGDALDELAKTDPVQALKVASSIASYSKYSEGPDQVAYEKKLSLVDAPAEIDPIAAYESLQYDEAYVSPDIWRRMEEKVERIRQSLPSKTPDAFEAALDDLELS